MENINEVGDTKNDLWMSSIADKLSNIAGAVEDNTNAIENNISGDIQDLVEEIKELKETIGQSVIMLQDSLKEHAMSLSDN